MTKDTKVLAKDLNKYFDGDVEVKDLTTDKDLNRIFENNIDKEYDHKFLISSTFDRKTLKNIIRKSQDNSNYDFNFIEQDFFKLSSISSETSSKLVSNSYERRKESIGRIKKFISEAADEIQKSGKHMDIMKAFRTSDYYVYVLAVNSKR